MKAAVFHGRKDLRLDDVPEQETVQGTIKGQSRLRAALSRAGSTSPTSSQAASTSLSRIRTAT
jgi:hypothetical protein